MEGQTGGFRAQEGTKSDVKAVTKNSPEAEWEESFVCLAQGATSTKPDGD